MQNQDGKASTAVRAHLLLGVDDFVHPTISLHIAITISQLEFDSLEKISIFRLGHLMLDIHADLLRVIPWIFRNLPSLLFPILFVVPEKFLPTSRVDPFRQRSSNLYRGGPKDNAGQEEGGQDHGDGLIDEEIDLGGQGKWRMWYRMIRRE